MGLLELRRRSDASQPVYPQMASTAAGAVRPLSSRGAAVASRPGIGALTGPLLRRANASTRRVPRGTLHGEAE
jgi:hypothetical protein